jgi:DNA invertase Pin-like site-specific DNA recombinase
VPENQAIPVVIYAAKSTRDEKDSTGSQIQNVRNRVALEGDREIVVEPFSEDAVSGFTGSRGPQLKAAIATAVDLAQSHETVELWVFHSSRLARGSGRKNEARSLLEVYTDLKRAGVSLRSVEDDAFVTDEMLVGFASRMAHKYSEDVSSHVRSAKQRQFANGERLGGPVPDGYRRLTSLVGDRTVPEYIIDEDRAPIIRRAAELALDNLGAGTIARQLNREGHSLKSGRPWNRRRVQDTLSNPFYAGRVVIHRNTPREQVGPGSWPALLDPEAFDRIQQLTAARDRAAKSGARRRGSGRPTTRYALSKLAVCDRCGARMYATTSPYKRKDGTQQRSYVCSNVRGATGVCDQPKLDAARVDAAVVDHLNRMFVDFDAWLAEMGEAASTERARLDRERLDASERLRNAQHREEKLRLRYIAAVEVENPAEQAALAAYQHGIQEREALERLVAATDAALAAAAEEAPIDAMLDVFNVLAQAVRVGSDDVVRLNERLRATFSEFRLDCVGADAVGVMPVLHEHVVERCREHVQIATGHSGALAIDDLVPATVPVVIFA